MALESRTPAQAGNPPDRKSGEPPQLVHRNVSTDADGALKPSKGSLPAVEGQLTKFDCNGKQAILHLTVSGSEELFVIEDPQKVTIRSAGGAAKPMDFHCGPQKNERLLVQYEEAKDESGKVTRFARILEFR
jgi:hypothetical protein